MNKLAQAVQWREEIENPEFVPSPHRHKEYMVFSSVSQKELNAICDAANVYYEQMDSPLRIGNSMGELRPGLNLQRELLKAQDDIYSRVI